jgi:hypothetical protein
MIHVSLTYSQCVKCFKCGVTDIQLKPGRAGPFGTLFCSEACLNGLSRSSAQFTSICNVYKGKLDDLKSDLAQQNRDYAQAWWMRDFASHQEEQERLANPNAMPSDLQDLIASGDVAEEAGRMWELFTNNALFGITGAGGTGKTSTTKAVLEHLRQVPMFSSPGALVVVAATNTAANSFGEACAGTLHSFFGVGILDKSIDFYVNFLNKNPSLKSKILKLTTLVVSEFFALDGHDIDKVSEILQAVRNRRGAFMGGIRLIPEGDVLQLLQARDQDDIKVFLCM